MMYHEVTYDTERRRRRRLIVVAMGALAIIVVTWLAVVASHGMVTENGVVALRDSISATATKCYAVEGAYPTSISYMEERYGLLVNHDAYRVAYEWLGDNVPPSVVVTPND